MPSNPLISVKPETCDGMPCIKGTRIPVTAVLRALAICGSVDEVIRCYPQLNREQVTAAIWYARDVMEGMRQC